MTDRPIIFSAPMVRALLAGTKTQTRRILKPQPTGHVWRYGWSKEGGATFSGDNELFTGRIPIWAGDRLWVRETWAPLTALTHNDLGPQAIIDGGFYRADEGTVDGEISKWKPSIFMPRHASRLTLTVTDVKVERLQDISDCSQPNDCIAEGMFSRDFLTTCSDWMERGFSSIEKCRYRDLWDQINGEGAWQANPWVAAYTFSVQHGNIDRIAQVAA